MMHTEQTRQETVTLLTDLIGAHVWIQQVCNQLAEQSDIDEVTNTLETTVRQHQSTISCLQKLIQFVEGEPAIVR